MAPLQNLLMNLLSIMLLAIFIVFLLHKGRKKQSNLLLALFFFAQLMGTLGFVFVSNYNYFVTRCPDIFFVGLPFSLLWAPALYLYVLSVCNRFKLIRWQNLLHFLPYLVYLFYFIFQYHILPFDQKTLRSAEIFHEPMIQHLGKITDIQVLLYNLLALSTLFKHRKKSIHRTSSYDQANLHWLKIVVFGYLIACFLDDLVIRHLTGISHQNSLILSSIVFFIFFILLFYKGFTTQEIFLEDNFEVKYKSSRLTSQQAKILLNKMDNHIIEQRPYLKPDLTIRELANFLNVQDRYLSQVINEYKKKHFYDFINSLRIEESIKLLSDPENTFNILQIMYEVGFNSKTAFNKAFKKHTGTTPSVYKKQIHESIQQLTGLGIVE